MGLHTYSNAPRLKYSTHNIHGMSDIRLIMVGVALVFAGFLVLGIFGDAYRPISAPDIDECISHTGETVGEDECNRMAQTSAMFFGLVLALLGAGIFVLIKGYRGRWDNEAKPEDMLGPGYRSDESPK